MKINGMPRNDESDNVEFMEELNYSTIQNAVYASSLGDNICIL